MRVGGWRSSGGGRGREWRADARTNLGVDARDLGLHTLVVKDRVAQHYFQFEAFVVHLVLFFVEVHDVRAVLLEEVFLMGGIQVEIEEAEFVAAEAESVAACVVHHPLEHLRAHHRKEGIVLIDHHD